MSGIVLSEYQAVCYKGVDVDYDRVTELQYVWVQLNGNILTEQK